MLHGNRFNRFHIIPFAITLVLWNHLSWGAPNGGLKITVPEEGTHIIDETTFSVAGSVTSARVANGGNWTVINPKVLCELYYASGGPNYLINSDITAVTFPDETLTKGAFDTNLTARMYMNHTTVYNIDATALDNFNDRTPKADRHAIIMDAAAPK